MGAKRATRKRTNKATHFSSEESSADTDDDKRRAASRRTTATSVSYKEASDDEKTGSDDLLEVDYTEPVEAVPEEKVETIEKILGQRRGKKGGMYILLIIEPFDLNMSRTFWVLTNPYGQA